MGNKKESYPCIDCKKEVLNNQSALECSICERWLHKDCGIDDDEFKLADKIKQKKGFHFWSCDGCNRGMSKLQKMVTKHETEINSMKLAIKDLEDTRDTAKTERQATNNKVESVSAEIASLKADNADIYTEMSLRERKRYNLVLFNVPEPSAEIENREKQTLDENYIIKLFRTVGKELMIKDDIKFVARIGEAGDKIRPLTVGLRSPETRDSILNHAFKLKDSIYSDISISPDLTKIQLKEDKELQKQADAQNNALTGDEAKNYMFKLIGIRGQRIIKKVKRSDNSQNQDKNQNKAKKNPPKRTRIHSQRRTRQEMEEDDTDNEMEVPTGARPKKQC